ncbi:hypothetical protein MYX64_04045 [Nitrospinae bacterium AH_259_B05_G02_I21]|nr:hypothetical protein [Nitrospinae bacterium AH_259_B05_G02_I21]
MARRKVKRVSGKRDSHDRKVREIARKLKSQGYRVKADLHTYDKPDPIGRDKYIPDIVAKRGDSAIIIEVDTPKTKSSKQISAFKRSAAQKGGEFRHVTVKPRSRTVKVPEKRSKIGRDRIRTAVGRAKAKAR